MLIKTYFNLKWEEKKDLKSLYEVLKEIDFKNYYGYKDSSLYKCRILESSDSNLINKEVYIDMEKLKWEEISLFYFNDEMEYKEIAIYEDLIYSFELITKNTAEIKKTLNLRKEGLICL